MMECAHVSDVCIACKLDERRGPSAIIVVHSADATRPTRLTQHTIECTARFTRAERSPVKFRVCFFSFVSLKMKRVTETK